VFDPYSPILLPIIFKFKWDKLVKFSNVFQIFSKSFSLIF
jgi:hypothetical protein